MRILQRLYRVWIAVLIGVVCIPIALTAWYVGHQDPRARSASAQITVLTPANDVAVTTAITVVFHQAMDPQRVAAQLRINPVHPYTLGWDDTRTVARIIPTQPWRSDTSYTVSIAHPDEPDWQWSFQTTPGLQVQHVIPSDSSTTVASNDFIVVRFSQAMVPQTRVHTSTDNTIIHIIPAVTGSVTWVDQYTVVFKPTSWVQNTQYTVSIDTQTPDLVGRTLATPYQWSFRTLAPQLTLISPSDGALHVALTTPIVLTATGEIDAAAWRASIGLWPSTSTRIDISHGDNDTTRITITPQPAWRVDTLYQFQIGGGTTKFALQRLAFTTAPALRLVARSPGENQFVQPDQNVRFIFNTDLDTRTLTDVVTLTPAPLTPAIITSSGRDIRIQAHWAPDITPEVRIDAGLRSSTGITLGKEITSQLVFDNRTPQITLPLTVRDILDHSNRLQIDITSYNVQRMQVAIYDITPAALVHILGMDDDTFRQIAPERYDLPVITTLDIPNPQTVTPVLLPADIRTRAHSRLVLVVASDTQNQRDVRLVRILPHQLRVAPIAGHVAVGSDGASTALSTIGVFHHGQLVEQGQLDAQGLWLSRAYDRDGTYIVLNDTAPYDAVRVSLVPAVPDAQRITLLSDRITATPGDRVLVAMARHSGHEFTQVVPLALCRSDGAVLSHQNIAFTPGQTLTHGFLDIPRQIAYGTYRLCIDTDTITSSIPLIVTAPQGERLRIQWHREDSIIVGRLNDAATHAVHNATIYWSQGDRMGELTTGIDGAFRITASPSSTLTLVARHQGESSIAVVDASITRHLAVQSTTQWVRPGDYTGLTIQIIDPAQQDLVRRMQVIVRNTAGTIATRQTAWTDATGQVALTLAVPRGNWLVDVSDGVLRHTMPLTVGGPADGQLMAARVPITTVDPLVLWYGESTVSSALIAQHDATGTRVRWAPIHTNIITTTVPLTSTFVQLAVPLLNDKIGILNAPVQTADCTAFTVATDIIHDSIIPITITAAPASVITLHFVAPDSNRTVSWQQAVTVRADGTAALQIPDDGQTRKLHINALVSRPYCSQLHHTDISIQRPQYLRLAAPTHTRVGDEVTVLLTLTDQVPRTTTHITAVITNAITVASPPSLTITSDDTGIASMQWRLQMTHDDPILTIRSSSGSQIVWQPVVDASEIVVRNDGFLLNGRTQINTATPPPSIDVLLDQHDIRNALQSDSVDAQNPSQLAHLVWLSVYPDERMRLLEILGSMRHDMPGWGWGENTTPDPLLTSDVVSALASAGVPRLWYQDTLPYLYAQLALPQLPATTQALIMRALVLSGEPLPALYNQLGAQLDTLGTEGLAAYLDILPTDQAYRIPSIMATLMARRHTVPRGSYWDSDPATSMLHTRDSVNALLLHAFVHVSVNHDIQTAVMNYLFGTRGIAGWGDAISNARMWDLRDHVFASLDGRQHTTIQLDTYNIQHNTSIWPAHTITSDTILQSDSPVLVGISQASTTSPASNTMLLIRNYSRLDGTPLSDTNLNTNDYVIETLDIVTFTGMNYLTITDPLIQLGDIDSITPPRGFQVLVNQQNQLVLYGSTPSAGIWHCQYRIRVTTAGSVHIPAAVVRDAAGTIHAQSQPAHIVVGTP